MLDAGGATIVAGANPWTLSGVVSGAGLLTLTGGDTLTLAGANTFTGGIAINDDTTLKVSASTNLGSGSVTLGDGSNRGTLDLTGSTATVTAANAFVINAGSGTIVTGPDPAAVRECGDEM